MAKVTLIVLRVCFVCLGNICRSPTAEGVLRRLLVEAGLERAVHVESAGTASYHVGELPDRRTREHARRRGLVLESRARHFTAASFQRFELVLAMDEANRRALLELAPSEADASKVRLLRDYDPEAPPGASVPDPYYGGAEDFERVLDQCERACRGLLDALREGGAVDR